MPKRTSQYRKPRLGIVSVGLALSTALSLTPSRGYSEDNRQTARLLHYLEVEGFGVAPEDVTPFNSESYIERLQPAIDSVFKTALTRTPLGRSLCRYVFGKNPTYISNAFGLSYEYTGDFVSRCAGSSEIHPWIKHPVHLDRLAFLQLSNVRQQRLIPTRIRSNFDSWTTGAYTAIPIMIENWENTNRDIRAEKAVQQASQTDILAPVLVHELAVYLDDKNFGWPMRLTAPSVQEHISVFSKDAASLIRILSDPLVYLVLSSVRAFHVEGEILTERHSLLKGDPSCSTTLLALAKQMDGKGLESLLGARASSIAQVEQNLQKLELIEAIMPTGERQNACQYFSTPSLSLRNIGFVNGPRPRLSGGIGGTRRSGG